jgi:hypothetical protein
VVKHHQHADRTPGPSRRAGAILRRLKALRAHVQNGQIVLDEPAELPEGVAVEVLLPDQDELSDAERTELDGLIEESAAEFARGEFEDAHAFARRLVARS